MAAMILPPWSMSLLKHRTQNRTWHSRGYLRSRHLEWHSLCSCPLYFALGFAWKGSYLPTPFSLSLQSTGSPLRGTAALMSVPSLWLLAYPAPTSPPRVVTQH